LRRSTVHRAVYRTDGDALVNLVYHNQHGRPRRREENEQNSIVRSGKSETEVTNNRLPWTPEGILATKAKFNPSILLPFLPLPFLFLFFSHPFPYPSPNLPSHPRRQLRSLKSSHSEGLVSAVSSPEGVRIRAPAANALYIQ